MRRAVTAYFIMTGAHPVFGFMGVSLPLWEIPSFLSLLQPDPSSWGCSTVPAVEFKAPFAALRPTGKPEGQGGV